MSKSRNRFEADWDDSAVPHHDIDVDDFIESMETSGERQVMLPRRRRSGRRLIEEMREARLLRAQLEDWDDWNDWDDTSELS